MVLRQWEGYSPQKELERAFCHLCSCRVPQHLVKIATVFLPHKEMASILLNITACVGFLVGCGGTLYGHSGSFTSPGYPGTYPNNTHCEWTIIAPAGRPVTVSFYFVSIDDPGDCVQNYLILYNGPDANSPSSGPYCGAVSKTNILKFPVIIFK